tara:strand:- start:615 stop:782 length:168 start_codon:yes stop_codon:yes gene_type:complete
LAAKRELKKIKKIKNKSPLALFRLACKSTGNSQCMAFSSQKNQKKKTKKEKHKHN